MEQKKKLKILYCCEMIGLMIAVSVMISPLLGLAILFMLPIGLPALEHII